MLCKCDSKATAKLQQIFHMTKFFDALFINISSLLTILKAHLTHNKSLTPISFVENFFCYVLSHFTDSHTQCTLMKMVII